MGLFRFILIFLSFSFINARLFKSSSNLKVTNVNTSNVNNVVLKIKKYKNHYGEI